MTDSSRYEGFRIHDIGSPDMFLVLDGERRHIPDVQTYHDMFRDNDDHEFNVSTIKLGRPIPSGAKLIRASTGPHSHDIYLFIDDTRRHISNPDVQRSWGFANNVKNVDADVLEAIPLGSPITYVRPSTPPPSA